MSIITVVVFIVTAGWHPFDGVENERATVEGLAFRDASLRNLHFRVTIRDHRRTLRNGPFSDRVQALDVIIDSNANARIEGVESIPDSGAAVGEPREFHFTETTSPEGAKHLTAATENPKQLLGRISKPRGLSWAAHPFSVLNFGPYSLSRLWQTAKPVVSEGEVVDGQKTIKIEWEAPHDNPPGSRLRGTILVAPDCGYSPLRLSMSRLPAANMRWRVVNQIDSKGLQKVKDLWLPQNVAFKLHAYYDDGEYELKQDVTFQFENWSVNEELPSGIFNLTFPDNTIIKDSIRGGPSYVRRRIKDAELDKFVTEAKTLVAEDQQRTSEELRSKVQVAVADANYEFNSKLRRTFFAIIGIALICIGAGVWFIRHWRRRA